MKKYLIIQLARFGDLIQTKRLVKTLQSRPESRVHLCVDQSLKPLAKLVYPDVVVHGVTAHGTGLSGAEAAQKILVENRKVFGELKSFEFNRIYNINFSPLNFRLAALFDADRVAGYAWHNGQEITGTWPSMAMRWSRLRRIGINLVDFWTGYCLDRIKPEDVNPTATPKGGGIGVVLAGRESRRSLPASLLATIVTTLSSRNDGPIYLLGGKSEATAGQAVFKDLPPRVQERAHNVAGKTNWADLVDIVGNLDMLLSPDTGTMHLAAHLGVPVRAFFLSSAWCFETGPYGLGHTVYQGITDCLPCLETAPCPYDVKCLKGFLDPVFQRFLMTNKVDHAPSGITGFRSSFDPLGLVFTPFAGEDSSANKRAVFRDFIRHHLGGQPVPVSSEEQEFAQEFYRQKDWMTEPQPPHQFG